MPPDAQLGWERGQLDTLLNPNRSVNGAPPVAACIARSRGLRACVTPYVSLCLCAPLLLAARASCLLPLGSRRLRILKPISCACASCWLSGRLSLARLSSAAWPAVARVPAGGSQPGWCVGYKGAISWGC